MITTSHDLGQAARRLILTVLPALLVLGIIGAVLDATVDLSDVPGGDLLLKLISPDQETSIATWFNVVELAITACVAIALAVAAPTAQRLGWWALGLALTAGSIDEIATVHEHLGGLIEDRFGVSRFLWIVPGALVGLMVLVVMARVARAMESRPRRLVILGLLTYLAGALGIQGLTGLIDEPGQPLAYGLATTLEEIVEMTGIAVVLEGLLLHATRVGVALTLTTTKARP